MDITEIAYHRNGVAGMPFNVVKFTDKEAGNMVAIVFPQTPNCHVAVMNLDKLADGDIAFGSNSYRGDRYAQRLFAAIKEREESFTTH